MFRGINGPFKATRYHSLVVDRDDLPDELAVTAETDDGLIMGLSHRAHPVHGVQFHPESIASEHGQLILKNFLDLAAAWNARRRRPTAAEPAWTLSSRCSPRSRPARALTRAEAETAFDTCCRAR